MSQAALALLLLGLVHGQQERHAAQQAKQELICLAEAIYYEARGEPRDGQKAVAEVVLARTRLSYRPHTICGVVYEPVQFSFTFDGSMEGLKDEGSWNEAMGMAAVMLDKPWKPVLPHRTTYFARYDVDAPWMVHMVKVAHIGDHVFYRPKPRQQSS